MFKKTLIISTAIILTGCATGFHHVTQNNEKVDFSDPVLEDGANKNRTYVLLEKALTGDEYRLVEISKVKPKISNRQQERIAFNANLTRYAVDYDEYEFENYVDYQNYGKKTKIMVCDGKFKSVKTSRYNPCTSDFKTPFIPTSITKAYTAGRMPYEARRLWDNPNFNSKVEVVDPWVALKTSGAIEKLGIKKVEAK
jgi:hypothetical protein